MHNDHINIKHAKKIGYILELCVCVCLRVRLQCCPLYHLGLNVIIWRLQINVFFCSGCFCTLPLPPVHFSFHGRVQQIPAHKFTRMVAYSLLCPTRKGLYAT